MEEVEEHLGTTDSAGAVQTAQHEVLGELKGKVVERVEYVKLDPDVFGDVLCIFFVDGTVLELEAGETPFLRVPSVVIPEEHNYLLNP